MNEYLILRLTSHSDQTLPWLVWSSQEQEVIASGEISSADQLHELQEKATGREVIALAPSVDCAVRQLPLPKKNRRQAIAALPFMLEDELAQDVDELHWSCYLQQQTTGDIAYVSQSKMETWLGWLADANIRVKKVVPEALALPEPQESEWHLVQIGQNWLVRQSQAKAFALDDSDCLKLWLNAQALDKVQFISHTPWPEDLSSEINLQVELAELPLLALVEGAINSPCNLRVGEYKDRSRKKANPLRPWRLVASLTVATLLLYLVQAGIQLSQLKSEEEAIKEQIVAVYQKGFPTSKKRSNLKALVKRELKKVGASASSEGSFLEFLQDIRPAYQSVKGLEIQSLRFDSKRGELKIQAEGTSFSQFEQFKGAVKGDYEAEMGALNNHDSKVRGTLTIRRVS